jgi:hypothetical protein
MNLSILVKYVFELIEYVALADLLDNVPELRLSTSIDLRRHINRT